MGQHYQFYLIQAIRNFFYGQEFFDVISPPVVENPGMEPHIHPFCAIPYRQHKRISTSSSKEMFLHTSPEFFLKKLLSEGHKKIFSMGYVFRDEPSGPHHRSQFIMLEWYRAQAHYLEIVDDVWDLIKFCEKFLQEKSVPLQQQFSKKMFYQLTVQELFQELLQIDILNYLDSAKLYQLIKDRFPEVPLPKDKTSLLWDDLFFLLFLNKIEPHLKNYPFLILYEYPAPLRALSTISPHDVRVCERFEVFLNGVEVANCYHELTDLKVQEERFQEDATVKKNLYGYSLPRPQEFYQTLERGVPTSSGIALGVDRLLMSLTGIENPFFDFINK